ncbi:hypothetical protein JM83_2506 [Gillisia sp. Hel_I_86]|uniref:FKBP-type peptidyl-prolyl cis-trans isomerase n=1 Tax=Gillisia sp. Hel_I_86 TaxID=1249981 RepID=UPI001199BC07|nr:hypothetical protein [Gillisia sp. Hel_I_86]TVZ27466.1 hypothetical protein JM83_2506 [Gillisia sp. Hel_I_86]
MMKLNKLFILMLLVSISIISCKKDDASTIEPIPVRDRGEQAIADDEALRAYLQTHFYNEEDFQNPAEGFDYRIKLDSIAGSNSEKTPLIDSDLLSTKMITRDDVEYTIYILKIREGFGAHPTFADSTFQNYKGELLDQVSFDNTANPVWFDHPGTLSQTNPGIVVALTETLVEFGGASSFTLNDDNTVNFTDDFGVGAVFLPSGLGYFNLSQGAIPSYSPLIFSFQLYKVNEADHDQDGIPSYLEDLDNDRIVVNDDSDGDNIPDYLDVDDDGDGTLTKDEITVNEDGTVSFPDINGNGIPNYLDEDEFENVNENQ